MFHALLFENMLYSSRSYWETLWNLFLLCTDKALECTAFSQAYIYCTLKGQKQSQQIGNCKLRLFQNCLLVTWLYCYHWQPPSSHWCFGPLCPGCEIGHSTPLKVYMKGGKADFDVPHFGAETQGFQGRVYQNDREKVTKKFLREIVFKGFLALTTTTTKARRIPLQILNETIFVKCWIQFFNAIPQTFTSNQNSSDKSWSCEILYFRFFEMYFVFGVKWFWEGNVRMEFEEKWIYCFAPSSFPPHTNTKD